jgi:hypothetical protein
MVKKESENPKKYILGLHDLKSKVESKRRGLWSGFGNHKLSSKKLSICQFINGIERLVIIDHFHKAKSLRLPGIFVANDLNRRHLAELGEQCLKRFLLNRAADIRYE